MLLFLILYVDDLSQSLLLKLTIELLVDDDGRVLRGYHDEYKWHQIYWPNIVNLEYQEKQI